MRATAVSLVYSIVECCAPVWCRNAHTFLKDSVLIDTLHLVVRCLRLTLTDHLPILSGIQTAELRRLGVTPSLAFFGSLEPDPILHDLLRESSDAPQERLRSRRPFVPAARKPLNNLAVLGFCGSQWTNYSWNAKSCGNASRLHFFIPMTSAKPAVMSLSRTAWVKLNCLQTIVGRFRSSMHKWVLAFSPNCNCSTIAQTVDHVLITRLIHQAQHRAKA